MELETPRLILREFRADDWPTVLAYQSEPQFLRYYHWDGRTAQDAKDFVQMFLDQQAARPRLKYQLAITRKGDDTLIGNCGIRLDTPDAMIGDIGYELAIEHWGQGYATEAAQAIVDYGFDVLGLHRIWAWCISENSASAHVLEKLGMQREGCLRENEFFKGRWWDTYLYGVLAHERGK
jgi:RimJ/RimL family protein N-acetyltransferase